MLHLKSPDQGRDLAFVVRAALVLMALAVAGGVYLLATVPPGSTAWYPQCNFHSITGYHCPGCGTSRGMHALLNGRFAEAVRFNSLMFVVIPVVTWSAIRSIRDWRSGNPTSSMSRRSLLALQLLVIVTIAFWVLRNLPMYPFNLLAPHSAN